MEPHHINQGETDAAFTLKSSLLWTADRFYTTRQYADNSFVQGFITAAFQFPLFLFGSYRTQPSQPSTFLFLFSLGTIIRASGRIFYFYIILYNELAPLWGCSVSSSSEASLFRLYGSVGLIQCLTILCSDVNFEPNPKQCLINITVCLSFISATTF